MSSSKNRLPWHDERTDTPGVYRRGNLFRVLTREKGKKVMTVFKTYDEAVEFKAAQPNRRKAARRARINRQSYASKKFLYCRHDPCAYCGGPSDTIDHIEPKVRGGSDHWTNLTASCMSCNSRKGSMPLLLFLARKNGSDFAESAPFKATSAQREADPFRDGPLWALLAGHTPPFQ